MKTIAIYKRKQSTYYTAISTFPLQGEEFDGSGFATKQTFKKSSNRTTFISRSQLKLLFSFIKSLSDKNISKVLRISENFSEVTHPLQLRISDFLNSFLTALHCSRKKCRHFRHISATTWYFCIKALSVSNLTLDSGSGSLVTCDSCPSK